MLERILAEYEVDRIFHLAALLSARSEFTPLTAHHVNVEGTLNLLEFAQREGESHGRRVMFVYPSSIAAYGLPDVETRGRRVKEHEWNTPITMYGSNKLYCEQLGRYYARRYKQLSAEGPSGRVDFRCVRFPGLISAVTVPSGGSSDYASEMIHAAARENRTPALYVPIREYRSWPCRMASTRSSVLRPHLQRSLTRTAYNVSAFNPSAEEIRNMVTDAFPRREHHVSRGREATGDRRFLAGER